MNALLRWAREAAMGRDKPGNIHVTVRGPYSSPIRATQLARYRRLLASDPLLVEGAGAFAVGENTVVYLKVHHPRLRQIWWKPDYPVSMYGFNPHLTIYEGTDGARAERVLEFLRREQIKLLTWKFEVTTHVSDQRDLFPRSFRDVEPFLGLVRSGHIRPDIINRLTRAASASIKAA
ncbi:MAG: hypothetical protein QM718_12930 [Steroidobacteraceae bacterium]